jgi:methylamine--corrinoid protein Co-methyltransferase
MTTMLFYEHSAWVMASVVSGGSIEVGAAARGVTLDQTSPMEPLLATEAAHAVAGMSRQEANKIVVALLEKYEDKLRQPPAGQKYQECFNAVTGKPNQEFITLYQEVRQEMTEQFGLRFPQSSPYL